MPYGGIKTYHIIILDFWKETYMIFEYQKDRRFTNRQRFNLLYHPTISPIITGKLKKHDSIQKYNDLIIELGYNEKYCDLMLRYFPII